LTDQNKAEIDHLKNDYIRLEKEVNELRYLLLNALDLLKTGPMQHHATVEKIEALLYN